MQAIDTENFKTRDAASYDLLTAKFDHFTERLTSPLAVRIVDLACLEPAENVLDVGTGTGVVALRAAEKVKTGGSVVGVDLSEAMLETARAKALKLGIESKTDFQVMDAERLEFSDASFDAVVSLFALLHFPDPLKALTEIHRVLKPGGRVVVAVGSRPPLFSISGLAHQLTTVPDLIRRVSGKQLVAPAFLDSIVERHLPKVSGAEESHIAGRSHNRTRSVSSLVAAAGFKVAKTCWQGHQAEIDTPEEFWEIQRTFSSIARKRLNDAPPEILDNLQREFLKKCRSVRAGGGKLVYPFAAFYVVAEKNGK